MNELVIEARQENMPAALDFVNGRLEGCPPKIVRNFSIAVDEIFSNIINYAYSPSKGDAVIRVGIVGNVAKLEFEDSGKKYNPLEKDDPDTTKSADEREIGGLGIFMVKNIMDLVAYRYENGKNILTMEKSIV